MSLFTAMLAGLLFGLGLILSGMTDPAKVQGFLDLAGAWDPSLIFVMAGALAIAGLAFPRIVRRQRSLFGETLNLPVARTIDRRLVLGSLVFGAGWGLAGYCPGPALASLATGGIKPLVFCLSMLAGMALFEFLERRRAKRHGG